jgi:hypothetical protein
MPLEGRVGPAKDDPGERAYRGMTSCFCSSVPAGVVHDIHLHPSTGRLRPLLGNKKVNNR